MPKFALRYPFFIIMLCLMVSLVGVVTVVRMPVDLFPKIDMPVVVVATFYNGMPPSRSKPTLQIPSSDSFTLGANIDHSESRSLTGVSLIKIYFKPGTDPECRAQQYRQSGHGRPAPPAAGHTASGGAGHGCLNTAGLPGDLEGAGTERNQLN